MQTVNRLQALVKRYRGAGNNPSLSYKNRFLSLSRRSKLAVAGAFTLGTALISTAGAQVIQTGNGNGDKAADQPLTAASDSASGQDATSSSALSSSDSSDGATPSDTSGDHTGDVNVSTSVTTTTDSDGNPSTQVTVNGQPVKVSPNGSTHQTMNDGNQQTNISVSQSASGDSDTRSNTNSHVHVFSHSTSVTNQEDSVSSH